MIGRLVLGLWTLTEVSGAVLVRGFIGRGGLRDGALDTTYPVALFANFSLGTASVVPIAAFLVTRRRALAVTACAQLTAVVVIGTVLALPWHSARRRGTPTPQGGGAPAFAYSGIVEASHGVFAWLSALAAAVAVARSG